MSLRNQVGILGALHLIVGLFGAWVVIILTLTLFVLFGEPPTAFAFRACAGFVLLVVLGGGICAMAFKMKEA